ncbi:MAG: ABC-F family ATP-binding cassette domain-containing protein [Desulfobacter sp.]|nr:MAG: ABC-F family ATP-binding cassette domain-containing protein [Desulfobacter sp.]
MNFRNLSFRNASFSYDSQSEYLFNQINIEIPKGWCGVIGENGSGKTTFLKLAVGELSPTQGKIEFFNQVCYCPQTTDTIPSGFEDLLNSFTADAGRLISQLGIGYDWIQRWDTLSYGERKKAQVASALNQNPVCLAMDEPSNHLDIKSMQVVLEALKQFKGIGLIVSHNRDMLNRLCDRCLFIETGEIVLRKGKYDQMKQIRQKEKQSLQKSYHLQKQAVKQLRAEVIQRRSKADTADHVRSKKRISHKDHDAKVKIDLARVSGKDGAAGKLYNQLAGRLNQAENKLKSFRIEKEYEKGFWIKGCISSRDVICRINSGEIHVSDTKRISYDDIIIQPQDRVAMTGPNGAGKSIFQKFLLQQIKSRSDKYLYIPQELSSDLLLKTLEETRNRSREDLGNIMTIVRRLGSNPKRLLNTYAGSPGEIKKLMIASAVLDKKEILLLDEPENHLDLISIEALEDALIQYQGCLIFITHDMSLVSSLSNRAMRFKKEETSAGWHTRIEFN